MTQLGNPSVTTTPSTLVWLIRMSTILSPLGDTLILIETLFSQWGYQYDPIGKPFGDNDTFYLSMAYTDVHYTIPIGRYSYLLSSLKPYSPNEDTNMTQLGNPSVTTTPSTLVWLIRMSTILSPLGDTLILIETLFSQWGYQYDPIGKPFGDNDTFYLSMAYTDDVHYTIPIGRYCYPDWNPILSMRLSIGLNWETLGWQLLHWFCFCCGFFFGGEVMY